MHDVLLAVDFADPKRRPSRVHTLERSAKSTRRSRDSLFERTLILGVFVLTICVTMTQVIAKLDH